MEVRDVNTLKKWQYMDEEYNKRAKKRQKKGKKETEKKQKKERKKKKHQNISTSTLSSLQKVFTEDFDSIKDS